MPQRIIYLVDTENVGSSWKILLEKKTKNDKIYLFYTENSPHISYADMLEIVQYPNAFEAIPCCTGKNALDFQLASYLGFLVKSAPKTQYCIFSKDTGYDALVSFWSEKGYSVQRLDAVSFEQQKKEETKSKAQTTSLTTMDDQDAKIVRDILARNHEELLDIHNELVQTFGMKKGSVMYKQLKPEIKLAAQQEKQDEVCH